jgi:hypothetical protein
VIKNLFGGWLTGSSICNPDAADDSGEVAGRDGGAKTIWNPIAQSWLTEEQVALLKLAFDIGYQDGGLQHARLVQSTLLQETIAGQLGRVGHRSAPVGKRSYGVMQVKVTAALDVLQETATDDVLRTDEEIIARLMTDDDFNIHVASRYLLFLREKTNNDASALVAYNVGLTASRRLLDAHDEFRYVKNVYRYYEDVVIPFNKKYLKDLDDGVTAVQI